MSTSGAERGLKPATTLLIPNTDRIRGKFGLTFPVFPFPFVHRYKSGNQRNLTKLAKFLMLAAIWKLRAQFQNWNHNFPNCDHNLEIVRTILGFCPQFENCGHNLWIFAAILKLWAQFPDCAHNSRIVAAIFRIAAAICGF